MNWRRIVFCVGVCVTLAGWNSTAKAQWGGGFGCGFGLPWSAYSLSTPPYFAIFPPVYYSHVTPRPYGFSPFAYPGGYPTPERLSMPSVPYQYSVRRQNYRRAEPLPSPAPAQARVPKPLTIRNPYVLAPEDRPERLADGRPMPQTISPASYAASSERLNRSGQVAEKR